MSRGLESKLADGKPCGAGCNAERDAMRGGMDGLAGIFLDVFSADLETATAHTDGLRVIQGDSLNERHSILFFRIHCSVLHII